MHPADAHHLRLEDYEEAVSIADEILTLQPSAVEGYLLKGLARLDEGRLIDAVDWFSKVVEILPDDHVALLHRGIALLRLARNEEAVRDLKAALKNHPDCDEAFYNLAIAYVKLGQSEPALDALQSAVEIYPPRRTEARGAKEFEPLRSEPRFKAVVARRARTKKDPGRSF